MAIQYKFFMIMVQDSTELEEEFNQFLRTVSVIDVKREFVENGINSFWSIVVEYNLKNSGIIGDRSGSKKNRVDYKELLSEEDFAVFVKLRDWRKIVADKEAIPVYTIFTNEQLAQIAQNRFAEKANLQKITGVGEGRIKKYGADIIDIISSENKRDETTK